MHIEVICLIYKSVNYLNFIVNQLERYAVNFEGNTVSFRIIANDPTGQVKEQLVNSNIPYDIFINKNPEEFYINRVYRAYNYGVYSSKADYVCLVNSDMCFNDTWLINLTKYANENTVLVSKLVESGKLTPGIHAIEKYFGHCPNTYSEETFLIFKDQISLPDIQEGGLYMPLLINKNTFIKMGGYPEGNIYIDGVGTCTGKKICSGDRWFFDKLISNNVKHYTVFDSIVYHFQEGEKDE